MGRCKGVFLFERLCLRWRDLCLVPSASLTWITTIHQISCYKRYNLEGYMHVVLCEAQLSIFLSTLYWTRPMHLALITARASQRSMVLLQLRGVTAALFRWCRMQTQLRLRTSNAKSEALLKHIQRQHALNSITSICKAQIA